MFRFLGVRVPEVQELIRVYVRTSKDTMPSSPSRSVRPSSAVLRILNTKSYHRGERARCWGNSQRERKEANHLEILDPQLASACLISHLEEWHSISASTLVTRSFAPHSSQINRMLGNGGFSPGFATILFQQSMHNPLSFSTFIIRPSY